jgi:hypothetical protein
MSSVTAIARQSIPSAFSRSKRLAKMQNIAGIIAESWQYPHQEKRPQRLNNLLRRR